MIYVYILQSTADDERFYVGISNDLKSRLRQHNAGEVFHTAKHRPWTVKNYIAFEDEQKSLRLRTLPEVRFRPGLRQEAFLETNL